MSTFYKLVSNLPFHPSVLGELTFYSRRLLKEEKLRRLGFFFMSLLLVMQVFGFISPPKPSLATSTNDIIYGATTKDAVLKAYNQNRDSLGRKDIKFIFDYYGIGTDQLFASTRTKIGSRQRNYISTGRATSPGTDTFIPIKDAVDGGIYQRPLRVWDRNGRENWYDTLTGVNKFGSRFWIIINGCGNIVFEQDAQLPNLQIVKKSFTKSQITPKQRVKYAIYFRNLGPGVAKNVVIIDKLPSELSYISHTSNVSLKFNKSGNELRWSIPGDNDLTPSNRWHTIKLDLEVSKKPTGDLVCNDASIDASNSKKINSSNPNKQHCIKIISYCPDSNLPIPPGGLSHCTRMCPDGSRVAYNPTCEGNELICRNLDIVELPSWSKRKFLLTTEAKGRATPSLARYYVNDRLVATVPFKNSLTSQTFVYDFLSEGNYDLRADIISNSGNVTKGCRLNVVVRKPSDSQTIINTDKEVANITQNIANANGTTAKPGDKLKYTIHVRNDGSAPVINLELNGEFSESINDVLEYTDLIDKGDAIFSEQTKSLSWSAVNIPPNSKITKSFVVQVKNPLPITPTSSSDPLSFDYKMQNFYGNSVTIYLDKPISKVVEQGVTVLPNTGPGASMIVVAGLFAIVGYFYYRNRLLRKEAVLIHREYSSGNI